ncbi:MAG TPA: acyl-CoA dehydratase activase-related protein [Vicinamibacteria bacterium]|nr:acyl-CoA dehydratase activase-related protein [Vicinamibacteria bacterium]
MARWSGARRSAHLASRAELRVGLPKALNVWSTHQFWIGLLAALGIDPGSIVFSSDTSDEQGRDFGKGRGTVDCCHPVKCMSGHYGELIFGQKKKLDVLLSPMIATLPSFLRGAVVDSLSCPRVMAAPENVKAGFLKERDLFAENRIRHVAPLVSLGDPRIVPRQLFAALHDVLPGLTLDETGRAVEKGYQALEAFNARARRTSREVLASCARADKPCLLVLARPYHMDPGIGHEIEVDLQAYGYPVLWAQYLPTDPDLMEWLFGEEVRAGAIRSPFDIADVWPSSYSSNTNEILWGAKVAARLPWITCVIRLSSYECGMDQPTYTPVQQIVERSGTLFFSFQDLDATRPGGAVKIRVETIAHYLGAYSDSIMRTKRAARPPDCPLETAGDASGG